MVANIMELSCHEVAEEIVNLGLAYPEVETELQKGFHQWKAISSYNFKFGPKFIIKFLKGTIQAFCDDDGKLRIILKNSNKIFLIEHSKETTGFNISFSEG